jgi:hypothetical protein
MVGVIVGPEHSIDPVDIPVDKLCTKVWRRVDKQSLAGFALDDDRDT